MTSRRSLPVPEGLDGLRLDAAISRLFGLSRTAAADLVSAGAASLDGVVSAKMIRIGTAAATRGTIAKLMPVRTTPIASSTV